MLTQSPRRLLWTTGSVLLLYVGGMYLAQYKSHIHGPLTPCQWKVRTFLRSVLGPTVFLISTTVLFQLAAVRWSSQWSETLHTTFLNGVLAATAALYWTTKYSWLFIMA